MKQLILVLGFDYGTSELNKLKALINYYLQIIIILIDIFVFIN